MKAKVIEAFTDLVDGGVLMSGEIIERDEKRIADLVSRGKVEVIASEKPTTRKSTHSKSE